jgi:hypothetical protein
VSDLTVAASEKTFRELFKALRDNFGWKDEDSFDFGVYHVSYEVDISLANGSVDLQSDNTVAISELDIIWNKLSVTIGIDLPKKCVGGWCIGVGPFKVCVLPICVFNNDPDVVIPLDLNNKVTSEVSAAASLVINYGINHPASVMYLDAQDAGTANVWQIYLAPKSVDVDPIDIADTSGDLLKKITDAVIAKLPGPQWAKDLILAWLDGVENAVRILLDLPDDFGEWLSDKLNVSFGLGNLIVQAITIYFASRNPLMEFEDPYPILEAESGLIPVKIPIKNLNVYATDDEMIVEADVGVS